VVKRDGDVRRDLAGWFSKARKVVVAGIGNPIRMDDFIGVRIVQALRGKVSSNVFLIECETVPESYMQQIIDFNPTHVLLIDAAVLRLKPGESVLVKPERLTSFPAFSTHLLPLRIFCEYLANTTRAEIGLLLIEPKVTDFGERLTPEAEAKSQQIAENLLKILP
jgi:hydrogenase 3 maturation protease